MQVDTGCIVAFEETVQYDIQLAGGIRTESSAAKVCF